MITLMTVKLNKNIKYNLIGIKICIITQVQFHKLHREKIGVVVVQKNNKLFLEPLFLEFLINKGATNSRSKYCDNRTYFDTYWSDICFHICFHSQLRNLIILLPKIFYISPSTSSLKHIILFSNYPRNFYQQLDDIRVQQWTAIFSQNSAENKTKTYSVYY